MRIITSSCGAYATDESGSLAKIGSAKRFGRSWPSSFSVGSGSPMIQCFGDFNSAGGVSASFVTAVETTPAATGVKSAAQGRRVELWRFFEHSTSGGKREPCGAARAWLGHGG